MQCDTQSGTRKIAQRGKLHQLIINLADGLLKYRTMRLFLIFLIFSILMGRENHTEIHKRTFENHTEIHKRTFEDHIEINKRTFEKRTFLFSS